MQKILEKMMPLMEIVTLKPSLSFLTLRHIPENIFGTYADNQLISISAVICN